MFSLHFDAEAYRTSFVFPFIYIQGHKTLFQGILSQLEGKNHMENTISSKAELAKWFANKINFSIRCI